MEAVLEKEGPKSDYFPSFVDVTLAKIVLITCLDVDSCIEADLSKKIEL